MDLFTFVSALGMELDPVLMRLDALLDDDVLFLSVKADLAQRFPRTPIDGRPSTPVEVILRLLVVKHLYGWSYAQTEQCVSDSLVLRQFCRIYTQRVPDDTTLLRWANLIQPATLQQVFNLVVDLARPRNVTRGRKLRIDGTVVETNIRYPVDSTLLGNGVRVLTRAIQRAKHVVQRVAEPDRTIFWNRSRSVQRVMRHLIETARRRGEQVEQAMKMSYKLVSVFEPYTAIIRKGKLGHPVEFGRVVWLDEADGGIITRYAILTGNPNDADQLQPSLDHHVRTFGRAPRVLAGDRKVYSPTGERYAQEQGVKHVVLPKPGKRTADRVAHEAQRWFRCGRNWRVGIEGRISVLKRRHKLRRCRYHGADGMERWVGWGIIAHNLRQIAQATQ